MKINKISAVLIWSEDYKALAEWYQKILGAGVIEELNHPSDTGMGLSVGDSYLWVGKHSEVKGQNKDPYRIMLNISVDSVEDAYNNLVKKGVEFIAKPFKAPTFDSYFATFKDPDGNILQFIGKK
jgi:uncharacterized glyoxalase superfamily protein PhnB